MAASKQDAIYNQLCCWSEESWFWAGREVKAHGAGFLSGGRWGAQGNRGLRKSAHRAESQCTAKMVARGREGKKLSGGLQGTGEVVSANRRQEDGVHDSLLSNRLGRRRESHGGKHRAPS